jgi:hypothetical protein
MGWVSACQGGRHCRRVMIDLREIPQDGEIWEQFAQEFLSSVGLSTESPPDRGADGGKDILMIERVSGPVHTAAFRWLVSCKHTAHSGVAVSETTHERNILERVKTFHADGFLGFYSTLPSAGLNTRLLRLTDSGELKAYKIFSGTLIESELLTLGRSWLVRRYFPNSYRNVRPLHMVIDEYVDLRCDVCNKDLLEELYTSDRRSLVARIRKTSADGRQRVLGVYFACKGDCDKTLQLRAYEQYQAVTAWEDISDIAMPNQFLRWIVALLNQLREGVIFSDEAFDKEKGLIMAISQKVFREVTEAERARLRKLMSLLP